MSLQEWIAVAVVAAILAVLFALLVRVRWQSRVKRIAHLEDLAASHIADIEEDVRLSLGGTICLLLLILHNFAVLSWFTLPKSAFQEASVAAIWTGGNVLWGIGILIGRRRTYHVRRVQAAAEGDAAPPDAITTHLLRTAPRF